MRKFFVLLVLVAFSAALAEPFVWPNAWSRDAGSATSGGTLRQSSISNPRTFNPFVSAEQNDVIDISDTRGAILITRGPDSDDFIPYAASSFSVSPDGTVIDMVLRDGIKWSDGTPVTVADYMFRYTAETDPDVESNSYDGYFINDEKILLEITGDNSLRWTFPSPDRTAFGVAALIPAPDHILGKIYRDGGAEALKAAWGTEVDPKETVWTGPWVPVSLSPDERLIMERNPYFGEWNVDEAGTALPYIDTIEISIVESVDAALNLYIAGNLDLFSPSTLDHIGVINTAIQNGDIDATVIENASPVASSQFITFNWNKSSDPFKENLFRSKAFRQAMSQLVDREAIVELVYGGAASPMYSSVYTVLSYWVDPDAPRFDYDPEAALAKLAELGFTEKNADGILVDGEGRALEFILATNSGNSQREQIAQIFADTAREVGVGVEVQALDFNLLVDQLLSTGEDRPFDAILIGLRGGSRDWPFGSNVVPCGTNLHAYNGTPDCLTDEETLMEAHYWLGRKTLDTELARSFGYRIQQVEGDLQPQIYTVSPSAHYSYLNNVGGLHTDDMVNSIVGSRELELTFIKK